MSENKEGHIEAEVRE